MPAKTRDKINWNNYLENDTQESKNPLFEKLMVAHKFGGEDMGHQKEDDQMSLIAMSTLDRTKPKDSNKTWVKEMLKRYKTQCIIKDTNLKLEWPIPVTKMLQNNLKLTIRTRNQNH